MTTTTQSLIEELLPYAEALSRPSFLASRGDQCAIVHEDSDRVGFYFLPDVGGTVARLAQVGATLLVLPPVEN